MTSQLDGRRPVPESAAASSPTAPSTARPHPRPRARIGWVVVGSLAAGLVAALLLVAAPFIPASISARLGLGRLYGQLATGDLPPRSAGEVRASVATAGNLRSTIDEYVQASSSVHQAAALTDFGAKPLVALTAGIGHDAAETAVQNHLATLSTNSAHRTIAGATHEGLVAEKKYAATTTQAILDVVSSIHTRRPLIR